MHATQASCFFSWRARLKVPAGSWSLGDPDEALGVGLDVEAKEILPLPFPTTLVPHAVHYLTQCVQLASCHVVAVDSTCLPQDDSAAARRKSHRMEKTRDLDGVAPLPRRVRDPCRRRRPAMSRRSASSRQCCWPSGTAPGHAARPVERHRLEQGPTNPAAR